MTTDIERGGIDVGGSHEPSYYEIALTNRQVVVAFVILLTCVVAAFFSGVWIGRESAARAQERLALLGRGRVLEGANADAGKGKQEGQALQEFKFFADQRPAAARVDLAAKGDAGSRSERSTLADDLHRTGGSVAPEAPAGNAAVGAAPRAASGAAAASASSAAATRNRRDGAGSSTAQATKAAQASQAPAAAEAAGEGEPLPGTPQPAAGGEHASHASGGSASSSKGAAATAGSGKAAISWSPAASATADASPAGAGASPASPAGAAATVAAGEVVIQVFSTADKEQADKVRDGLVHAGFTAFLSPIAKGGQTMYRVRIGPFPSRTAAEPVAEKVRKERKLDTWITPK
ncbi:MAG TPA: SPOR domain-containing protein [Thermoanaerobaculia bacterium]